MKRTCGTSDEDWNEELENAKRRAEKRMKEYDAKPIDERIRECDND